MCVMEHSENLINECLPYCFYILEIQDDMLKSFKSNQQSLGL